MMTLTNTKKEFISSLKKSPYTSALILANWWYFYKHKNTTHENKEKIFTIIHDMYDQMSHEDFLTIWNSIVNISHEEMVIKEKATRKIIAILKHNIIKDTHWLKNISEEKLVDLGADQEYTREIIVGLIRKHLMNVNQLDVFENYDYVDIMKSDLDQSILEVNSYIKKCQSLPIEALKKLGKSSAEIARIVMKHVSSHYQGFEIIAYYAEIHESLRDDIVENWKSTITSLGYDDEKTKAIKQQAEKLSVNHPEFKIINSTEYLKQESKPPKKGNNNLTQSLYTMGTGAFLYLYNRSVEYTGSNAHTLRDISSNSTTGIIVASIILGVSVTGCAIEVYREYSDKYKSDSNKEKVNKPYKYKS